MLQMHVIKSLFVCSIQQMMVMISSSLQSRLVMTMAQLGRVRVIGERGGERGTWGREREREREEGSEEGEEEGEGEGGGK